MHLMMKAAELKRDFARGLIESFKVQRYPMGEGWMLVFVGKGRQWEAAYVAAAQSEPRMFKTLDAAVRQAEDVGFRVVELDARVAV